ncbi:MAG: MBL fold metallo-hydrolase [Clostridia bacterium]|nr:MBL fold metallo-hydrolase [Clostridia bacterium]
MISYRICTLYSGSGGNSTYIEAVGKKILIDAGKNARSLCRALSEIGSDIGDIDAIFITHEHTDHVSALEIISKKYEIPIHIAAKSAERFDREPAAFVHKNLVRHDEEYEVCVGDMRIRSFRTPHDSMMSVGYRIDFCDADGEHSVGLATDIGYVTRGICRALEGCEAVVIESNHDEDMLKRGSYPYDLKKRILSNRGHLSNKSSAAFCAHLSSCGARAFLLAHLSEENNTPELALDEFISAIADPSVAVTVASADAPTDMIFFEECNNYAFGEDNNSGNT